MLIEGETMDVAGETGNVSYQEQAKYPDYSGDMTMSHTLLNEGFSPCRRLTRNNERADSSSTPSKPSQSQSA